LILDLFGKTPSVVNSVKDRTLYFGEPPLEVIGLQSDLRCNRWM
jgi:hypothetical protein